MVDVNNILSDSYFLFEAATLHNTIDVQYILYLMSDAKLFIYVLSNIEKNRWTLWHHTHLVKQQSKIYDT